MSDIDKITEALEKQAIDNETKRLAGAIDTYRRTIGLQGMSESIKFKVKIGDEKVEVFVSSSIIFEELTKQIVQKRSDRLKKNEISTFLKSFAQFGEQMEYLADSIDSQ